MNNAIEIALPSVRSLLIEMRVNGNLLSSGTGFVVESRCGPVLITNRHNVTGRRQDNGKILSASGGIPDTLRIVHNRAEKLGEWVVREEALFSDGRPLWHEHPTLGAQADFVGLPLKNIHDTSLFTYNVSESEPPIRCRPAQTVSVVGFPFGIQGGGSLAVWATGFIATEPDVNYNNLPVFLIDCRSRPGQSGSAVIVYGNGAMFEMKDGGSALMGGEVIKLLGVYSGRINDQSDLGIVWKASAVAELVANM